jgi:hypothetical protein
VIIRSKLLITALLNLVAFTLLVRAQHTGKPAMPASLGEEALDYFAKSENGNLESYLRRIRPVGVSADRRARLVASIRKEDIVSPSFQRQAKLDQLLPILTYHDRGGIEVKVVRLGLAWAGFFEGAAIIVSEETVDILTADELQAIVAHELGHEYFAAEYELARNNKQKDKVKEVELRCDGVAIITLSGLGLNPNSLSSAVSKLTKFNEGRGMKNNPALVTSLDERLRFFQAMTKLAETRVTKLPETARL